MIRSYLKIALRTLWKQKGVAAINVFGLAAGLAVCLLVGLLLWDQVTHDRFHPGADRIHRVLTLHGEDPEPFASSPAGLGPVLRTDVAGIETATRLRRSDRNVSHDNQGFGARGLYAEPEFFDLFGFEMAAGEPADALRAPFTAVVTTDLARRLYGTADAVGQTFDVAEVGTFTVTGVVDRDAYRSHLGFDVLYSFATLQQTRQEEIASDWTEGLAYYTYLRLAPGTTPADVAPSLKQIEAQYLSPESVEGAAPQEFRLQALSALPLSDRLANEIATGMLPQTVGYFLAVLALVVLLAAGFNYVNLSTARSLVRAREVGVRKVMGAPRAQVMAQFVAEGVVVSLLALGIAVALLQGLVPLYNQLSIHQTLAAQIDVRQGPVVYGGFLVFAVGVGALAGAYPAWHLSKFRPAEVLKASVQGKAPGFGWMAPRKVLTVGQFAVALIVIVTAALVYQQTRHMGRLDRVGVKTENVGRVALQDASLGPFRTEARSIPGVRQVGAARNLPLTGRTASAGLRTGRQAEPVEATYYPMDHEALQILGFPLTTTDGWSASRFERGQVIVANEAAVQALGFASVQEALGASVSLERGSDAARQVRIAAVTPNFYYRLSEPAARPVVLHHNPEEFRVAIASLDPSREQGALAALGETWQRFDAVNPPDVGRYRTVVQSRFVTPIAEAGGVLAMVAVLAALIGCLGLLGIATYTVQTRTREVGIRKALGASVLSVTALLSREVAGLVGAAIALGLPLAWWLNRLWLQNVMAYRIEMGVLPFALAAIGLAALALVAVGSQTLRAAKADPATVLRSE